MKIHFLLQEERRKIRFKAPYPRVFKNTELHQVAIIYKNRVEYYGKGIDESCYTYLHESYDPYHEIEMLQGSGFKEVRICRDVII